MNSKIDVHWVSCCALIWIFFIHICFSRIQPYHPYIFLPLNCFILLALCVLLVSNNAFNKHKIIVACNIITGTCIVKSTHCNYKNKYMLLLYI